MTLDRLLRTLRSPGMVLFTLILGTTLPLADTTSMKWESMETTDPAMKTAVARM